MGEIITITIGGREVTLYALLAVLFAALAGVWLMMIYAKRGWKKRQAALYWLGAGLLGLFLGRLIYCLVRYDMFEDAMGRPLGLAPFFDPEAGSLSVIGVLAGVLLAGLLAGKLRRVPVGEVLDAAALPGLALFSALRFVEPLSGEGYGPLTQIPILCRVPLGMRNGWGEWSVSVCFMEGLLLLLILLALARVKPQKAGTLSLLALVLLSACQIIPESLRRDDVLRIFIFARVTQIGYAFTLFCPGLSAWMQGTCRGLPRKTAFTEAGLVLLGIGLIVAGEFALDKTQWSDVWIYLVMLAILAFMAGIILRRIFREDSQQISC